MQTLVFLSYFIIPIVLFYIVGFGVLTKTNVYAEFIKGAEDGIRTVAGILPTLVGLMVGVGLLRASGTLDALSALLRPVAEWLHFPAELIPVTLVKLFSSSAATGLVLDLFERFGPDSEIGTIVSLLCSCTETVFYTMSVYFLTAQVRKTRWTLSGCLFATGVGIVMSVLLGSRM